ncbi:hypothetical protein ACQPYK_06035 [Streptosporangium sp. CA-135522]|uniref:hypothetical protein n=1 Tax=Streptosporangium sp. CA-135522 TaxID=3240072 RepID=UPI003D8BF790
MLVSKGVELISAPPATCGSRESRSGRHGGGRKPYRDSAGQGGLDQAGLSPEEQDHISSARLTTG